MTDSGCTESMLLASATQDSAAETATPTHSATLLWSQDAQGQPRRWRAEQEDPQRTRITTDGDALILESAAGLTLWLEAPLSGTYRITFTREVRVAEGDYDRLSDVNQFWAARDPRRGDLFTRQGQLSEYDDLALYYVGMGGNWNSTTRFRRYDGQGARVLLGEYTDAAHLLQPNRRYRIQIDVDRHETRFLVDDALYFSARYDTPPPAGHFGFRMVFSHQIIRDFAIVRR